MRNKMQSLALAFLGMAIPLTMYSKGYFFVAIILAVLLGVASLKLDQFKKGLDILKSRKTITFIPLFITIVLSVVFSIDQSYSLKKLTDIIIVLIITFLLAIFLANVKKGKYDIILKSMLAVTLFDLCYLYYDMYFASKEFLIKMYGIENIGPGRVRYAPSQLAVILPFLFGYLYVLKNKKLAAWLLYSFALVTIFATGGRSAMLSFCVGSFFMFGLMLYAKVIELKFIKVLAFIGGFILLVCAGLFGYKYLDSKNGGREFETRISHLNSKNFDYGRVAIWKFAFNESLNYPVLGVGIGAYKSLTAEKGQHLVAKNHSHNFILEILISTGVIGLITSATFLLFLFISYLKTISTLNPMAIFSVTSFATYWLNSLASVSIIQTYWLAIFAVSAVIGNYLIIKYKKES